MTREEERAFKRRVRASRLGVWLAYRAGRQPKSLLDRLAVRLLDRALAGNAANEAFIRDELVDAEIGFSARELEAYQRSEAAGE